jgi:hypothetical protein
VRSVNDAPIASFTISPLTQFPDFTNQIVLAPLTGDATVILDASASSDAENDPLQFSWFEGTNNFATGMIVTNQFAPDTHEITLDVSDGQTNSQKTSTFEVITPAQAVGLVISLIDESDLKPKQPLIASLNAATRALGRGNAAAALNELKAFQNKVNAQVIPENPVLGAKLLLSSQKIITALEGPKKLTPAQSIQVEERVDTAP